MWAWRIAVFLIFLTSSLACAGQEMLEIATRPGVTVKVLLQTPETVSKGLLLLLPGGTGAGHFGGTAHNVSLGNNFLVRSSSLFVQHGYAAAIIDVPSDHLDGMSDAFRTSVEHTTDIQKVIDTLTSRGLGKVFLVGTSRGTISAVHLAAALKSEQVSGLVLTATLGSVAHLPLDLITVPVLLVHHIYDSCTISNPSDAAKLKPRFVKSPRVDFVEVSGGESGMVGGMRQKKNSSACSALTHHGFLGIENKVVTIITDWLSQR